LGLTLFDSWVAAEKSILFMMVVLIGDKGLFITAMHGLVATA